MRLLGGVAFLALGVVACTDSESPPSLVGTWRELRSLDGAEATRTFGADGTFSADHDIEGYVTEVSGPYQVNVGVGRVGFPDHHVLDSITRICDFTVTEDRLMLCALFPSGAVDGLIGTWRGNTSYRDAANGVHVVEHELTLMADGSATFVTPDNFDRPFLLEGSWSIDGERLDISTTGGNFELGTLPGVIGLFPSERVD